MGKITDGEEEKEAQARGEGGGRTGARATQQLESYPTTPPPPKLEAVGFLHVSLLEVWFGVRVSPQGRMRGPLIGPRHAPLC